MGVGFYNSMDNVQAMRGASGSAISSKELLSIGICFQFNAFSTALYSVYSGEDVPDVHDHSNVSKVVVLY